MIVCLVFVFCALLEYAFVNVATRNGVQIRRERRAVPLRGGNGVQIRTPIVRNALPLQTIDRGHQLNVRQTEQLQPGRAGNPAEPVPEETFTHSHLS